MREFWDSRADEDAFYFVDNRLALPRPGRGASSGPAGARCSRRSWACCRSRSSPTTTWSRSAAGSAGSRGRSPTARRRVRAIDVSARMLARARELNPALDNVTWLLGDGSTLCRIEDASADVCFSYVVFQHIPDPEITLGYVREMGRVLRPGGWAAFQVSNDPRFIAAGRSAERLAARSLRCRPRSAGPGASRLARRGDRSVGPGQAAASESGMAVERVVGEGTQHCHVLLRRREASAVAAASISPKASPSRSATSASREHEAAARLRPSAPRSSAGLERTLLDRRGEAPRVAAARAGPTSSLTSSGRPASLAGDDRHLHRQRLLGDDRHRVAVAVGGDDARHSEQVGVLQRSPDAVRLAPAEQPHRAVEAQLARPASSSRTRSGPSPTIESRSSGARSASSAAASIRSLEALLLDQAADRDDVAAAGMRPAAAGTARRRRP